MGDMVLRFILISEFQNNYDLTSIPVPIELPGYMHNNKLTLTREHISINILQ